MPEIRVALQDGSEPGGNWIERISPAPAVIPNLPDFGTGEDTGWSLTIEGGSGVDPDPRGVPETSGGAEWATGEAAAEGWIFQAGESSDFVISGLTGTGYRLEVYGGTVLSGDRVLQVVLNGVHELQTAQNDSGVISLPGVAPLGGEIAFRIRHSGGVDASFANAFRLIEESSGGSGDDDQPETDAMGSAFDRGAEAVRRHLGIDASYSGTHGSATVRGVFSAGHQSVTGQRGPAINSRRVLFAIAPLEFDIDDGSDEITINGITYTVASHQPDVEGTQVMLVLKRNG